MFASSVGERMIKVRGRFRLKIWSYSFSTRIEGKGDLVKKANNYFEVLEVQGFSPKSIQTYAFVLLTFFRWLEADYARFKSFTQKHLQDWMIHCQKKNLKPNSINQRLATVRAFYFFQHMHLTAPVL